jgi:uncharacterized membrane protein
MDREYMVRSWSQGLVPHVWRRSTIGSLVAIPVRLIEYLFDVGPWSCAMLVVLCAIGVFGMRRSPHGLRALLLLPLAAGYAASLLGLMSLSERLGLWAMPFVVLLSGMGISRLNLGRRRVRVSVGVFAGGALLVFTGAATLKALPESREELRPVLAAISERGGSESRVYVYYGAVPAFRYYAARFPDLSARSVEGSCARNQWRRCIEEIVLPEQQAKVWVLFSHWQRPELDFILRALGRFGKRSDAVEAAGSAAYLYSLEGRSRSEVSAEVARLVPAENDRSEPNWVCLGGPLSARTWPEHEARPLP